MQFFKIEAKAIGKPKFSDRDAKLEFARDVCIRNESFYLASRQKVFMFVSSLRDNRIIFGAILTGATDPEKIVDSFCKHIKIECTEFEIAECVLSRTFP